jgi:glucose-6-phosphate 1-dehydrogenase
MKKDDKILIPTTIIIFGATGDLVRKKIIKSLFRLYSLGYLPEEFRLIGVSRRDYSDQVFRKFLLENAFDGIGSRHSKEEVTGFLEKVFYFKGDFKDVDLYLRLKKSLEKISSPGICDNKLFYLAVPPGLYSGILDNISGSRLAVSCSPRTGWTRILVEKPFGNDISTARKLDNMLGKLFREEQVFRIDHYLAKDTIQNILFFRFSNILFEPAWNSNFIKKVEIKLLEDVDVETRGAFYDSIGALRDVGQNHMLQMLALVAMDNPRSQSADAIRRKRLEVLNSIIPINDPGEIAKAVLMGQYRGYRETRDVAGDSMTETYFKIRVKLAGKRWAGVPFYMESGKALKEKKTEIMIYFHKPHHCLCTEKHSRHEYSNILSLKVFPREGILLRFLAKKPGLSDMLEARDLEFDYRYQDGQETGEYDRVMLDCMKGDQTLFTSTDEIRKAWDYITPIIENWDQSRLRLYDKGSDGPQ